MGPGGSLNSKGFGFYDHKGSSLKSGTSKFCICQGWPMSSRLSQWIEKLNIFSKLNCSRFNTPPTTAKLFDKICAPPWYLLNSS